MRITTAWWWFNWWYQSCISTWADHLDVAESSQPNKNDRPYTLASLLAGCFGGGGWSCTGGRKKEFAVCLHVCSMDGAGACRPGQCPHGALHQTRWWQDLQAFSVWGFATNSIVNKVLQLCRMSESVKSQTLEVSSRVNTQVVLLVFAPFHTEM